MAVVKYRIRHDDQVMVMKGRELGKTGKVARVIPKKGKVIIEKLNIVKRHTRPSDQYRQGGIIEKEVPISISNVRLICEKCGDPVRTGWKILQDGRKVRYCKKCSEVID